MSLLPEFELGVWNAWILMLFFPLQPLIMMGIDRAIGTGDIWKKMGDWPEEEKERRLNRVYMVIELLLIAYSIFLPLKAGTSWLIAGLAVYLAGLVMMIAMLVTASTTPSGQPFTTGIYRFSRHPGYLSQSLILIGVGVASASWVVLLVAVFLWFILAAFVAGEERTCLHTFGEPYRDYLERTPRWIGIPRSR